MSPIFRAPKSRGGCPSSPPASGVSGLPQGFPSTPHRLSLLAPPTRHPSWGPLPTFLPSPCTGLSQSTSLLGLGLSLGTHPVPSSEPWRGGEKRCCRAFRSHCRRLSEACFREAQGQQEGRGLSVERGRAGPGAERLPQAWSWILSSSLRL